MSDGENTIGLEFVIAVHDEILALTTGLAGVDKDELEGALARPDQQMHYNGVDDIFEIGAWYAVAIAKAHAFNDGNKRTGLSVMLTYLDLQGVTVPDHVGLDDTMVEVVESKDDHEVIVLALAAYIRSLVTVEE
ncbi:type II toxin-antitoxin system death-on-curing family toxin [Acinetobacter tibetensis]|uniref:type II toxin-antitoxin system death-on-curing family toxin n=1 Tax=Acinetobacter tibetensis TaxID=2943497 RepID=UPI003A4D4AC9